jgi:hypothetical protein
MVEAGAGAAVAEIAEEAAGVEEVEVEEAGEEVVEEVVEVEEEVVEVEEEVVEVEEVDMLALVCLERFNIPPQQHLIGIVIVEIQSIARIDPYQLL